MMTLDEAIAIVKAIKPNDITVAVTGGRTYANRDDLFDVLGSIHRHMRIKKIVHGGATGADALAHEWSILFHVLYRPYCADWNMGNMAGPFRNSEMLNNEKIDLVVACVGGTGTADMVEKSLARGIPVFDVKTKRMMT